jgi:hypothetical protein
MIELENKKIEFGNKEMIDIIKRKKDLSKTKVTIDLKKLISIGIDRNKAINLMERLTKK